jgi:hypothetical protein
MITEEVNRIWKQSVMIYFRILMEMTEKHHATPQYHNK